MSVTDAAPPPAIAGTGDAETITTENDLPDVPCPHCRQTVPAKARKCTKCDEWVRGWRSVTPLSETALSLLLGLISVISIIGPKAIEWIWPDSETTVSIATADGTDLLVDISNTGRRPSVVRSYSISFDNSLFPPSTIMGLREGKSVYGADLHDVVRLNAPQFSIAAANQEAITSWLETGEVTLTASVKESNNTNPGEETPREDKIAARRLRNWITTHIDWERPK
ncbi:MAG TPA: hypothetical protein VKB93_13590 [Thermoanaerobaculia bacterium]|nr:hypothetical protein [Thermoanaerobaculia bacterium]